MSTVEFITLCGAGLSSIGVFGTRAFVPAFLAAVGLRLAQAGILDVGLLKDVAEHAPTWFTSNTSIGVLGLLAVLEVASRKQAELRDFMDDAMPYVKAGMAALTFLASHQVLSLDPETQKMLEHGQKVLLGDFTPQHAGFGPATLAMLPAALVAAGTFAVARTLNALRELFHLDDDDGPHGIFSWAADGWAVFGIFLCLVLPLLAFLLSAAIVAAIFWLEKRAEKQEQTGSHACAAGCGFEAVRPSAPCCPQCKAAQPSPREVGWLGGPLDRPADDPAALPMRLALRGRCPRCAAPLSRGADPECPTCGARPFADPAFCDDYAAAVLRRLPLVLLVCGVVGIVPFAGLVVAAVVSRMALVRPLSIRVSFGRRVLTKWLLRIFLFILGILQLIPVVGCIPALVLALVSHRVWRTSFLLAKPSAPGGGE